MAQDDYLPTEDGGKRRRTSTDIGPTTNRIRLGTGMGHASTSRIRRVEDPFEDDSSGAIPAVSPDRPSTSRIRAKLEKFSHICQPCRHMFLARRKPLNGSILLIAGTLLYTWYSLSPLFEGAFWFLVMHAACIIFVIIGLRQFMISTDCPNCGSDRTSRLDTAHGRQIQTETIVRTGTSYIRKEL